MKTLIALLFVLPIVGFSQTKISINKNNSTITYAMNHIMHAWEGTSNQLNGIVQFNANGQIEKVAILTKVSSFDSKSSNRDAHMLEVVESLKYPNISFQSTSITETNKEKIFLDIGCSWGGPPACDSGNAGRRAGTESYSHG